MWYAGIPLIVGILLFAAFGVAAALRFMRHLPALDWRQRLQMLISGAAIGVFTLCMLNFAVFWTSSIGIGGEADKVENGRFFVVSHGRHTEVSEAVWTFSYYNSRSIWITHPLGMLSIAFAILMGRLLRSDAPKGPELYPENGQSHGNDNTAITELPNPHGRQISQSSTQIELERP